MLELKRWLNGVHKVVVLFELFGKCFGSLDADAGKETFIGVHAALSQAWSQGWRLIRPRK